MSARVKYVVSGDTLVFLDKQSGRESQLSLAYLDVPRPTDALGFDAREHLRNLVLSKPIRFQVLYNVNNRDYGDVSSPIFQSLSEYLLFKGWAKLRNDAESRPGYSTYGSRLVDAQSQAQSQHLGLWSEKRRPQLNIRSNVPDALYGSGRQVPAIVERVISGDRIMLRAMMDPDDHYVGLAMLAGIRTHRTTTSSTSSAGSNASFATSTSSPVLLPGSVGSAIAGVTGDAFGDAAADLLSTRLLQRPQVRAVFVTPSKNNPGIPLVTLLHPQGDIALVLVRSGLAEVPNMPEIGAERLLELRNCQREAIEKGVGLFRAAAEARQLHKQTYSDSSSEAVVIKVLSADTIVLDPGNRIVQLSSTRGARRSENPEHAAEAREFARKLLIGQTVSVHVDGETKFLNSDEKPRPVVTLSFGHQKARNAALEIIRAGWATALRHRRDDLARSPFYDEFVAAEEAARASKKGVFAPINKTKAKTGAVVDASESVTRARGYLSSLERRGKIPAVVENVLSAGRFKLGVPSENCTLIAVLDGVRVPRASEPFSDEALAYTTREWNQRDVQVSVRSVDKTGAFVATIMKNSKSIALDLLSHGYATIHEGSANASGLKLQYDKVQDEARNARRGLWANYEEPKEDLTTQIAELGVEDDGKGDSAGQPKYLDAVVTHVTPEKVYVRLAYENAIYHQLKSDLQKFFSAAANTASRTFTKKPRRRETVITADSFDRGVITSITPSKAGSSTFELEMIDIGGTRFLHGNEMHPIPKEFATTGALAKPVTLRYVHKPVILYEKFYMEYLSQFVNQPVVLIGDIVFPADSVSSNDSINSRIIAKGYASVPVSQADEEGAQAALQLQEDVKTKRVGMWEYGDPREDDDL